MYIDSREADDYRLSLMEKWCEAAGIDIGDLSPPFITALIAATNDILDMQALAMAEPGEVEA